MPNALKEHRLDSLLDKWHGSPQHKDSWTRQAWHVKDLAQDQELVRKINKGHTDETDYGRRIGTDEDAQSDASREIPNVSRLVVRDAVLQAWWSPRWSQRAPVWPIAEEDLRTDPSFDAEPESCEAERDDQPGIIDEITEEWTSDRLADELLRLDVEKDWPRLRELILTAEDFDFTPDKSALLAPRLLDLAVQYRDSNDSEDRLVVWSATRTGASMLRPNEASWLLPLLEPGHPIETSLVALKMLGRIFEAQPPERLDQHTDLGGKVRGIAESLLNRYAIASIQSAAMAQLAVCTLAAMASNETLNIVRAVRRIGVSWFLQQTARELRELQSSWDERTSPVAPEVLGLLDRAMNELQAT
jgi:hypothetical protein